jgi:hypothetical protein
VTPELPPAERDRILRRIRTLAVLMDGQWEIPGTGIRFGIDAIVGLIPGGGDLITTAMALYIASEAKRLGIRPRTFRKMLINIVIDAAAGAVPLLGDVFDVAYRANTRNLRLLELDLLEQRPTKA